eukprot:TRINITY_DN6537_c0_g1_i1.p1 TRINITY_DN6537_c0_g1~~TRINITY_DN6537_c0_g1_i1.p1  ORF type:complete len:473 (-),score=84.80 TRINITY_DN6537_c0_g1_i1:2-1420(-)
MKSLLFLLVVLTVFVGSGYGQDSLDCFTCEFLLNETEQYVAANASVQQMFQALNIVCAEIPDWDNLSKDCTNLVKKIAEDIPPIISHLNDNPYSSYAICAMVSLCTIPCCVSENDPEQIHLSITSDPSIMNIMWTTSAQSTGSPIVYYGTGSSSNTTIPVAANTFTYTSGGWLGKIHTVNLTHLEPSTVYYYRVGSIASFSSPYNFKTRATSLTESLTIAVVADMGEEDPSTDTIANLISLVPSLDFILHVGDISYADGFQQKWDQFFRKVQPITGYLPYMTVPGNHEIAYDFESWKTRFATPFFYSFDYNEVHFVGLMTEGELDIPEVSEEQVQWLIKDLENRKSTTKWTIVYGHRPFYCSNDNQDCGAFSSYLRYMLEDVFYKYKVDLVMVGHKHDYERTLPVYQNRVVSDNYVNPAAPVYVVNGCAGNREGLEHKWVANPDPWSVVRKSEFGYGPVSYTHLTLPTTPYV